jgi:ribosomal protein S18 acetylase RimI-like enzyme
MSRSPDLARAATQIRPAIAADAPELFDIRKAAILAFAAPAMRADRAVAWADAHPPAWMHAVIRERDVHVFERAGAIVGWVGAIGCRIDGLYVSPPHAGCGVGRALLKFAESQIAARGLAEVVLDASVNAIGFYGSQGYEPVGDPHPDDGPTCGAQPMRKRLV